MAIVVHWHALVPTSSRNCAANTHNAKCTWPATGLTPQNEVKCKQPGGGPSGRPCKCEHDVPASPSPGRRRKTSPRSMPQRGRK
jgi:hypothetical protein